MKSMFYLRQQPLDSKEEHLDIFINDLNRICYSWEFIP
jgi:hypothetical protein